MWQKFSRNFFNVYSFIQILIVKKRFIIMLTDKDIMEFIILIQQLLEN